MSELQKILEQVSGGLAHEQRRIESLDGARAIKRKMLTKLEHDYSRYFDVLLPVNLDLPLSPNEVSEIYDLKRKYAD